MKLLLFSNSTTKGEPYLGWPKNDINTFLSDCKEVVFIPYAGITMDNQTYTQMVVDALGNSTLKISGLHSFDDKEAAILNADCIMVGGGNTFNLLATLQSLNLIEVLQRAVKSGCKYVGWSAGSNIACPTIKTTNDMPIIQPQSFNGLNLVGFHLNPHFTKKTIPNHGGESRVARLTEFMTLNQKETVIGLDEGMYLEVKDKMITLRGEGRSSMFSYAKGEIELDKDQILSDLL